MIIDRYRDACGAISASVSFHRPKKRCVKVLNPMSKRMLSAKSSDWLKSEIGRSLKCETVFIAMASLPMPLMLLLSELYRWGIWMIRVLPMSLFVLGCVLVKGMSGILRELRTHGIDPFEQLEASPMII